MRSLETNKIWNDMNTALNGRAFYRARQLADELLSPEHRPFLVDYTWTEIDIVRKWNPDNGEMRALAPLIDRLNMINKAVERNWA